MGSSLIDTMPVNELIEAVWSDDVVAVNKCLNFEWSPNESFEGLTALYWAIMLDFADIAELLIVRGAEVGFREPSSGQTLLMRAASGGQLRIVELLERAGANPSQKDENGVTALHLAAKNGHLDCAEWLIDRCDCVNDLDNNGRDAIYWSVAFGRAGILKLLISRGSRVDRIYDSGRFSLLDMANINDDSDCVYILTEAK